MRCNSSVRIARRWGLAFSLQGALNVLLFGAFSVDGEEFTPGSNSSSTVLNLLELSLEELANIKVTTVSRKSESLSEAAAAIHVITQEDIRRSGVTTLPEALRMSPGLVVSQANARQWAISARGFNGLFANKLLVLMDGRSIYTPLFSGVFWEETDTVLEDLDRIEVVRGPGAALWGANAVNGVINVISKDARETQGALISGGGGIEQRGFGSVRYGGQLSSNVHYRVYSTYANRDESTLVEGGGTGDSWWTVHGGFRLDWEGNSPNRATLQGDFFQNRFGNRVYLSSLDPPGLVPTPVRAKAEGANLLARWRHDFSDDSDISVQAYYDRADRGHVVGNEIRDTADLDVQHRFAIGERHDLVWGAGYRFSADEISESPDFMIRDSETNLQLASAFVQEEWAVVPDRLRLTLGTKLEHNDFTGFEIQPSARLAWLPRDGHMVWGAVSRAVRTPSRGERGFTIFAEPPNVLLPLPPFPFLIPFSGSPEIQSEELMAFEIGYRVRPHRRLSVDWTAFYHDYDNLRSTIGLPLELRLDPVPHLLFPATVSNDLKGESYGTEISARWRPLESWRLRFAYSLVRMKLHAVGASPSLTETEEGLNPQQQASVWSDMDLGQHVEWGLGLRFTDELPTTPIPPILELDARLAWKPSADVELSLVGRNLLDRNHREYPPEIISYRRTEVDRAVYAKVTWRF